MTPAGEGFFLDRLRRRFSAEEARRQLDTAVVWGCYGEPFEYDAESGQLALGSDPAKVGRWARTGLPGQEPRSVRHKSV
jgi:NitT/TauT family transport system ATP-binding protein